jgi:hypothetical protein
MSRHPATFQWIGSISIAVGLALTASCSKPDREAQAPVSSAKPVDPAPTPAPSKPVAPAPATPAPAVSNEPTPAETPVTPELVPAAQANGPKASPAPAEPDPLKLMQESETRRVEYERSLVQLAADIETAKAGLAKYQRDLLAFRNPYLARPILTDSEAAAIQGMNGAERVQWAESRVANGIAAVESAQKAYDDAKANPPAN